MRSNLERSSVLTVAGSYIRVGLKFERAFSMRSSPALKRSSLVKNALTPQLQKCLSAAQQTRLFSIWKVVRNPPKKNGNLGQKGSLNLHFSYGWS